MKNGEKRETREGQEKGLPGSAQLCWRFGTETPLCGRSLQLDSS